MAPLPIADNTPEITTATSPSAAVPCNCLLSSAVRLLLPITKTLVSKDLITAPGSTASGDRIPSPIELWLSSLRSNPFLKSLASFSEDLQRFFFQKQCKITNGQIRNGNSLSTLRFAAILPGDSVAGLVVANGLSNFLNLYNTLLVVRLVLTWFPGAPPAIVSPLSTLCDPYLNIFRGLIPPLGGTLDLSPILAFLVLNAFTSTAAALPAELPEQLKSQHISSSSWLPLSPTSVQQKWSKRMCNKQKKHKGATD